MPLRRSLFAALTVLAFAHPAFAADSAAGKRKAKVAVLDVRAAGSIDPKTFEGLAALIASELGERRPDVTVVGSGEIRALIGFEREKQLVGCSDGSCLAEVGGALGVDYLVITEGSRLGGTWLVSMSLLDVAKSKALKRVTKRTEQETRLVDTSLGAIQEIARAVPGAEAPVAAVEARPADAPLEVKAAAPSGGISPALTWTLVGGGVAVAGAGAGLLGYSWSKKDAYDKGQLTRAEAGQANTLATVGVAVASVGGAALLTGVILALLPDAAPAPKASLVPTRGGAYASLELDLP